MIHIPNLYTVTIKTSAQKTVNVVAENPDEAVAKAKANPEVAPEGAEVIATDAGTVIV